MDPNEALRQMREALQAMGTADRMPAGPDADRAYGDAAEQLRDHAESLDGWLSRGGFLPNEWTAPNRATCCRNVPAEEITPCTETSGAEEDSGWSEPALPPCAGCGLPLETAEDGTVFVSGTGTSADGLSFCPPDPDVESDDTHTFPTAAKSWRWSSCRYCERYDYACGRHSEPQPASAL